MWLIRPLATLFALAFALLPTKLTSAQSSSRFNRDVLPILSENCFHCHGPDSRQRQANLRLDLPESAIPLAITPHDPEASSLYTRLIETDESLRMPPPQSHRQLTPQQIATLKQWIAEGAHYESHWSFLPVRRPTPPPAPPGSLIRNPIDAFVAHQLTEQQLLPSPDADRATLIRRISLDLTGLPPSLEDLDRLLRDPSSDWYEKWVDQLLQSSHYGERMVWEWLEAARYADTNGYQGDPTRAMWYWRDWAIQAFNDNMPFDQFTIAQLAGDLYPSPSREQLIATGFHRNHMINGEGGRIAEESRVEYVQDRVETTSTVWLGLTLNCARCHDHKFDPVSQREYYQLAAYFNSIDESGGNDAGGLAHPILPLPTPEQSQALATLQDQVTQAKQALEQRQSEIQQANPPPNTTPSTDATSPPISSTPSSTPTNFQALYDADPAWKDLQQKLKELTQQRDQTASNIPKTMIMRERQEPRPTFILDKGAYNAPGLAVEHGLPAFLHVPAHPQHTSRMDLATWLTHPDHPLTARVTINRFWQQFFGTGIVKSADNFGLQGDRPSHPDLLDWLAAEFIESNWNVKQMIRLIVTSHTYRQSSHSTPTQLAKDPDNRWLSHAPRYRWPSWLLRDQALAVSGLLTDSLGGPPVKSYQPDGIWEEATFGQIQYSMDRDAALYRRSLYLFWRRIVGPTNFFDTSNRQTCSVLPSRTNTPMHALVTLNETTFVEAARHLAISTLKLPTANPVTNTNTDSTNTSIPSADEQHLNHLFRRTLCRFPNPNEQQLLIHALNQLRQRFNSQPDQASALLQVGLTPNPPEINSNELAAWTTLANLILNLDETLSKE